MEVVHDFPNKDPLTSTTGAPTNTNGDNRLFALMVTLTVLVVGILLTILTSLIIHIIRHRHRRSEEKQKLPAVLYTHTGSQTTEGRVTILLASSEDAATEVEQPGRNESESNSNTEEMPCLAKISSFDRADHAQEDSVSENPPEYASITVSEEHRRNTQQFFDVCSKSKSLVVPNVVHKAVQSQGAQTVEETTSSGDSQETQRTMATCGSNSPYQVSLLGEYTESNEQYSHPNKRIYKILRGISWVEGYYSEGRSIEVYVNSEIPPKWALRMLKERTGFGEEKFIVRTV